MRSKMINNNYYDGMQYNKIWIFHDWKRFADEILFLWLMHEIRNDYYDWVHNRNMFHDLKKRVYWWNVVAMTDVWNRNDQ